MDVDSPSNSERSPVSDIEMGAASDSDCDEPMMLAMSIFRDAHHLRTGPTYHSKERTKGRRRRYKRNSIPFPMRGTPSSGPLPTLRFDLDGIGARAFWKLLHKRSVFEMFFGVSHVASGLGWN